MLTQPSRPVFWRFVFATLAILTILAGVGFWERSCDLHVDLAQSRAWQMLFTLLAVFFLSMLAGVVLSYFAGGDKFYERFESLGQDSKAARWLGVPLAAIGLFGFVFVSWHPLFRRIMGRRKWSAVTWHSF